MLAESPGRGHPAGSDWHQKQGVIKASQNTPEQRYAQFVMEGVKADSPWAKLKGQVFLGDAQFVKQMQARLQTKQRDDVQIPIAHRRPPPPSLRKIERSAPDRNAAIVMAYAAGAYSYHEIATHFGIHFTTVGRIVRSGE